jgi:hypothetical protein
MQETASEAPVPSHDQDEGTSIVGTTANLGEGPNIDPESSLLVRSIQLTI